MRKLLVVLVVLGLLALGVSGAALAKEPPVSGEVVYTFSNQVSEPEIVWWLGPPTIPQENVLVESLGTGFAVHFRNGQTLTTSQESRLASLMSQVGGGYFVSKQIY